MDDEIRRLKSLIENATNALEELRRLDDPELTNLLQELERARAEAVAELAQLRTKRNQAKDPPDGR
jgi:hypothetical protein